MVLFKYIAQGVISKEIVHSIDKLHRKMLTIAKKNIFSTPPNTKKFSPYAIGGYIHLFIYLFVVYKSYNI